MATTYIRPLLEVFQQLQVTQAATGDHLAACIIGANYDLYRYGQEQLTPTTFSSQETLIPFVYTENPALDYQVDLDSVSVYAEGLEASLATFANSVIVDPKDIMTLRLNNGKMFASTDTSKLDTNLMGYPVSIGDVVYVTSVQDETPRRRTVVDVVGAEIPALIEPGEAIVEVTTDPVTIGSEATADISPATDADYSGARDTTYILQCTKASEAGTFKDAEFKVTDTSGVDVATFVTIADNNTEVAIGTKGVKLLFNMHTAGSQLSVNDTFSFICVAAQESTTDFDGIQLDAMPVDAASYNRETPLISVELRKMYTGAIPSDSSPDSSWTVSTAGVTIAPMASLYIPERTADQYVLFVDQVGELYVGFRVMVIPQEDEDIVTITSAADIVAAFGAIDPENELAYGCNCCLTGTQGRAFYAIRVRSTDVAGFTEAVKKTEADAATYSFAPITNDIAVMDAVVQFNADMSEPDVKKWRRTIVGVDSPGEYVVASTDNSNKVLKATITADDTGAFVLVQLPEDVNFDFKAVAVNGVETSLHTGDKVQLLSNGAKYTIKRVLSSKEILLISGPNAQVNPAMPISIWKANTATNAAEYVTSVAKQFNTRRAIVVWCDGGTLVQNGVSTPVANKFLAAEIAGLSSSVLPQKSITHTEVGSINKAVRMYTQYTQTALDNIASQGVLIVTQDTKNASCYIRHQLTTEMDKGSLYYEDSCTRNIDNISYAMTDILEPFIGQANVTPSALRQIEIKVSNALNEFTADTTDDMIGPSLVSWDNLRVYQDPKFMDRIIIEVDLYLPLPLNNIRLYEMAYIATVTI